MTLPIDRSAKAVLDLNLVNGILSDGPKIKSSNDVVYNTIDELNQKLDNYQAGTRYSVDGGAFTDVTATTVIDGGTF